MRTIKLAYISTTRSCSHKKCSCFDFSAHSIFRFNIYSETFWVIVSFGTQIQPQIILALEYCPDYIPSSMTSYILKLIE